MLWLSPLMRRQKINVSEYSREVIIVNIDDLILDKTMCMDKAVYGGYSLLEFLLRN